MKDSTFSMQAATTGLLVAFVGFGSSFAVVVNGLLGVGASQAEAASGLAALSIAMGLCGVALSLRTRMPISVAWSTPGAALLATTGPVEGGFAAAVGAFLVCAVLIVISGLWPPLSRWVSAIPASLANAMLSGVLLGLCLAPVRAVAELPLLGLTIIGVWLLIGRFSKLYAVPVAALVTFAVVGVTTDVGLESLGPLWLEPVFLIPQFNLTALIGIALPLFIVTMASQNVPGVAVLKIHGYNPAPGPLLRVTGLFSLASAPFGGHAVNLAAITAAMCAGEDAHPDPARRYWSAVVAGLAYILFGLAAAVATAFMAASPPVLIEAVAGLALLGVFGSATLNALKEPTEREAAVITFLVTASGLTFFGIGGAFWGLIAGGAVLALSKWRET